MKNLPFKYRLSFKKCTKSALCFFLRLFVTKIASVSNLAEFISRPIATGNGIEVILERSDKQTY